MDTVNDLVNRLLALDERSLIRFIILYGSSVRGEERSGSDLDICIYFDAESEGRDGFRVNALKAIFSENVDIHMFQDLPLQVRSEVLKGKVLYSDDDVFIHDTAYRHLREYGDFKHRLLDYLGMERIS